MRGPGRFLGGPGYPKVVSLGFLKRHGGGPWGSFGLPRGARGGPLGSWVSPGEPRGVLGAPGGVLGIAFGGLLCFRSYSFDVLYKIYHIMCHYLHVLYDDLSCVHHIQLMFCFVALYDLSLYIHLQRYVVLA